MGLFPFWKKIEEDHAVINRYELAPMLLPKITAVEMSGLADELEAVELPDRTRASGGGVKPGEFTLGIPMHHVLERTAMDLWFVMAKAPSIPGYKRRGTLSIKRTSRADAAIYEISGMFPTKRQLPNLEQKNPGELAVVTYTISYDGYECLPGSGA